MRMGRRVAGGGLLAAGVAVVLAVAIRTRPSDRPSDTDIAQARKLLADRRQAWWSDHAFPPRSEPIKQKGADVEQWASMEYDPPGTPVLPLVLARVLLSAPGSMGETPFSKRALVILDVRPRSEFFAEHIPGSRNVPVRELHLFPADLDRGTILVVTGDRYPYHDVIARVRAAGFQAVYALEGGLRLWAARRYPVECRTEAAEFRRLVQAESEPLPGAPADDRGGVGPLGLKSLLDTGADVRVVFVGDEETYKAGHIPGSVRLPMSGLDAAFASEAKDRLIAVYCGCCMGRAGGFSEAAVRRLRELGFSKVLHLDGHFHAWRAAGYPVATAGPGGK